MKKLLKYFIVLISLLMMITGCSKPKAEFQTFVDGFVTEAFEEDDYSLNMFFNDPSIIGIEPKLYKLKYYSKEAFEEDLKQSKQELKELKKYKYHNLSEQEQYDYDIIEFALKNSVDTEEMYYHNWDYLSPSGLVSRFALNLQMYSFNNKFDIDAYINLIESMPEAYQQYVDHEKARLDKKAAINSSDKKKILDLCLEVIEGKQHFLLKDFENKIYALDFLNNQEKVDYVLKNEEIMESSFKKAHEIVYEGIKDLDVSVMDDLPLAKREGGKEYYEMKVKSRLGKDLTIDQIADLMKDQFIGALTDFQMVSLSADMDELAQVDAEISPRDIETKVEMLYQRMKQDFPDVKHPEIKTIVIDKSMEDTFAPAAYKVPKYDVLDEPETLIVNPKHNFDLATLVHESYPGHMLQNVYTRQNNVPMIRSLYDTYGYVEGWAKYVERYTPEYLDLSENSVKLYALNDQLNHALSTLMDIDVNYIGISLEEFENKYGESINTELKIEEAYYMMQEDPGSGIPYYVGAYLFENLREQAQNQLKENYSDKLFHEILLKDGPLPFNTLERKIKEYELLEN